MAGQRGADDDPMAVDNAVESGTLFKELFDAIPLAQGTVGHAITSDPLAQYENTNHSVVSAQEVADSLRFMDEASMMIDDLGEAIDALRYLKWRLEASKRARTRFMSSVGRLPVEILTKIFVLARQPHLSGHPRDEPTVYKAFSVDFNAAQVCRRWRSIALNTPKLWHPIYVHGSKEMNRAKIQGPLEMLSRLGSVPPYLVIELAESHARFSQDCRNGLISAFEQRCKGLDVYLRPKQHHKYPSAFRPYVTFQYSTIETSIARFAKLERLTLLRVRLDVETSTLFAHLCELTHLRIEVQGEDMGTFSSLPVMLTLRVLVFICGVGATSLSPAVFFSKFPNLTDFFLHAAVMWTGNRFNHARLQRVCLSPSVGDTLLPLAVLPSIKELGIAPESLATQYLTDFFRRSKCHLNLLQLISSQDEWQTVTYELGERFSIPNVVYSRAWGQSHMMRDLQTRWYEQDYVTD